MPKLKSKDRHQIMLELLELDIVDELDLRDFLDKDYENALYCHEYGPCDACKCQEVDD